MHEITDRRYFQDRKNLISDKLPASSNLKSIKTNVKVQGLKSVERRKSKKVEFGDKFETE